MCLVLRLSLCLIDVAILLILLCRRLCLTLIAVHRLTLLRRLAKVVDLCMVAGIDGLSRRIVRGTHSRITRIAIGLLVV